MLDVIAGYDPNDPITAFGSQQIPKTYTAFLDRNGLKGARIGILMDFFGSDPVHQDVNAITEVAIKKITEGGATMIRINIPHLLETFRFLSSRQRPLSIIILQDWDSALR